MRIATGLHGCRLRAWSPDDRAALVRIADNRRVWRNLTDLFPHPYTDADAGHWIAHATAVASEVHYAIEFDGALAGGIGLIPGAGIQRRTAQFGYWLGEPFWGRGIATAAARALVQHARETLPFARIEAQVFAWNPASMRVLEKCGFSREGVLRLGVFKDGELIDSVLYSCLTGR